MKCDLCSDQGESIYGFVLCSSCQSELRLFTDQTLQKHYKDCGKKCYEKAVQEKLNLLEETYIKRKVKLCHILDRLKNLS